MTNIFTGRDQRRRPHGRSSSADGEGCAQRAGRYRARVAFREAAPSCVGRVVLRRAGVCSSLRKRMVRAAGSLAATCRAPACPAMRLTWRTRRSMRWRDCALFPALGEDLEEQFRAGLCWLPLIEITLTKHFARPFAISTAVAQKSARPLTQDATSGQWAALKVAEISAGRTGPASAVRRSAGPRVR